MILLVLNRPEDPPTATSQWNPKHRWFRRLWWHHRVSFKAAEKKRKMLKSILMTWFKLFGAVFPLLTWNTHYCLSNLKKCNWLYMGNNNNVQRRTWIMDYGLLWICDFTLFHSVKISFLTLGTKPSNKGHISEDVFTLQKCLVLNDYF